MHASTSVPRWLSQTGKMRSTNSNPKASPLPELTLTCPNRNLFSKFIMSTDAILNQSEPNVILTTHSTKVNRTEQNWTEPQTCLACRNHASNHVYMGCSDVSEFEHIYGQMSTTPSFVYDPLFTWTRMIVVNAMIVWKKLIDICFLIKSSLLTLTAAYTKFRKNDGVDDMKLCHRSRSTMCTVTSSKRR